MKKIAKGKTKNWFPPHAEIENAVKIPAPKSLEKDIFLFWEFIPLNNK